MMSQGCDLWQGIQALWKVLDVLFTECKEMKISPPEKEISPQK